MKSQSREWKRWGSCGVPCTSLLALRAINEPKMAWKRGIQLQHCSAATVPEGATRCSTPPRAPTTEPRLNKLIIHRSGRCPGSAAIAMDLRVQGCNVWVCVGLCCLLCCRRSTRCSPCCLLSCCSSKPLCKRLLQRTTAQATAVATCQSACPAASAARTAAPKAGALA